MSGLDGLGHPEPMTAASAAYSLRFVADDHSCCAHALVEIIAWLEHAKPETRCVCGFCDGKECS